MHYRWRMSKITSNLKGKELVKTHKSLGHPGGKKFMGMTKALMTN